MANAQEPNTTRLASDTLFEQGKTALREGNWTLACDKFRQSQKLDPSPSTLVKLARCSEHDGHYKAALIDYERALTLIRLRAEDDNHARELRTLVQDAKGKSASMLGTLRVRLPPSTEQFQLEIDGEAVELRVALEPIVLDPGKHRISVNAPGKQPFNVELTFAEGEFRELTVQLKPSSEPPLILTPRVKTNPILAASTPKPAAKGTALGERILTVGSVATGGLLLGVAGYYAIKTRNLVHDSRNDDHCSSSYECDPDGIKLLDEATRAQTKAIVFGSIGALIAGLGVVLWATPSSERERAERPRTALQVGPSGVLLRRQW